MKRKITLRVNDLCQQRGWNEAALVYFSGLSPLTCRTLMRGETERPAIVTMEALLQAFDLDDVGDLFEVTREEKLPATVDNGG